MTLDFKKGNGLMPVVIQDVTTKQVLMLGYMNEEAFEKTKAERKVTFYSRSKQRLWTKGETSGNFLVVKSITADCDNDTMLIQCEPQGPTCHTGTTSCFGEGVNSSFIHQLEQVIGERAKATPEESYTAKLLARGLNKVAQKVGEEAVEVVIEAKDDDPELFKNEVADLLYHLLVLLQAKSITLSEIEEVLRSRH